MLRLTEIKLPLNHEENALTAAILAKLQITAEQLHSFTVFKRGFDARKKSDIQLIYTLDLEVANEAQLLSTFASD